MKGINSSVLVIDDDPGVRRSYARLLERAGFSVTVVESGSEAYEELRKQSFGAIVLDIQMPSLTGLSFYEQLEERLPGMAARVVFVSGFIDLPGTREFLTKTGRPFLAKPPDTEELVDVVRRVVEDAAQSGVKPESGES